jgi:hypothetical protein
VAAAGLGKTRLALGPRRSSVEELVRCGGRRTGGWSRLRDTAGDAEAGAGERMELMGEGGVAAGERRWGGRAALGRGASSSASGKKEEGEPRGDWG